VNAGKLFVLIVLQPPSSTRHVAIARRNAGPSCASVQARDHHTVTWDLFFSRRAVRLWLALLSSSDFFPG